jgi:hypothetical protein
MASLLNPIFSWTSGISSSSESMLYSILYSSSQFSCLYLPTQSAPWKVDSHFGSPETSRFMETVGSLSCT